MAAQLTMNHSYTPLNPVSSTSYYRYTIFSDDQNSVDNDQDNKSFQTAKDYEMDVEDDFDLSEFEDASSTQDVSLEELQSQYAKLLKNQLLSRRTLSLYVALTTSFGPFPRPNPTISLVPQ